MKILITGGAGFIGSNFVYYFLEKYKDWNVVCLDKLTYAANIHTLDRAMQNRNFKFIQGDIADRDFIFDVFDLENFDVVVNFAAESHVDKSIEDSTIFLKTNVLGTQVLMDASRRFRVKRFHQVSTDEVYGDLPMDRPDLLFTESSIIQTSSPYAASKAAADLLAQSYFRTYGFPVTISRCSNNYGPFQFLEKLIPSTIIRALKNQKLPIYGTGENIRDWLHVSDHCTAIDLILVQGKMGEVYNIGGNNERTNLQVVSIILKELGKSENLIEYAEDRPGHDLRYAVDSTKIKNLLFWESSIRFEKGIVDTVRWYQNHQDWWKDMIWVL
ncbi:dTDP-glucose 4,6-dehydratase [Sinanaerobacter chloroacetimidivorans]|jgi:dTDP-glucose 4,6-dehydratase|uniref:dTDP-glucose 4,6-dehydratase n=1 Tax=Sinanaerobacter chloroacetimidivorans TaxID=2818044 RepID=A0A8J7VYP9_9FIRM|nr:dTDP-glucose 4,6-dehydratase [Sinanaerobacter chloroacetimidivorans]MBR0597169.1 dTDP-glucose 4,6-dehydratase [Sinanaerobacter chloroacetimidivorans]